MVDGGDDDVGLVFSGEAGGEPGVEVFAVGGGGHLGENGLAAGGQLVDDRNVEIAESGHGKGAGDGGGGHHQCVWGDAC